MNSINKIVRILDHDWSEETTTEQVAESILNAIAPEPREGHPPLREGLAFKSEWSSTMRFVNYIDDTWVWVVDSASRHGWLGKVNSLFWGWITEGRPQQKTRDLMATNEEGLKVGMELAYRQGAMNFRVVAVAPKCALLRDLSEGTLYTESNDELKKFYIPRG